MQVELQELRRFVEDNPLDAMEMSRIFRGRSPGPSDREGHILQLGQIRLIFAVEEWSKGKWTRRLNLFGTSTDLQVSQIAEFLGFTAQHSSHRLRGGVELVELLS